MFGLNKKNNSGSSGNILEESLHDEKAKSEIILNSIDDGVVLIDIDKKIQLFNKAAENITGWSAKDASGMQYKSVINFVDEKNQPYDDKNNLFEQIFIEKTPLRDNKVNLLTQSQKTVPISLGVSPLKNKSNQIIGAVGVFRDVTNERQQEKQSSEFISTASHEMRTPVAAIEGYLALALNENVAHIDSKAREYLEKAHTSTQQLGRLFQDLLTSAKAEDGRLQSNPSVIEMSEYMAKMAEDLRFSAEKKGLAVEYLIGGTDNGVGMGGHGGQKVIKPLYFVYADPDRLHEAIGNICDNAVKFTETGKITIGLTGDDRVVQITVHDTGLGIPPEDIHHLFQKFYRVDNSATRSINGTGLGLFICRKIIELYSGRIWVDSKLGEGSTFYINLPRLSATQADYLQLQNDVQSINGNTKQSLKA